MLQVCPCLYPSSLRIRHPSDSSSPLPDAGHALRLQNYCTKRFSASLSIFPSLCGERFAQKSNLNTHTLAHAGVKKFECEVCGKLFSLKHSLTNHALIHTGAKDYQCGVCEKRFTLKRYLSRHMQTHKPEKKE
ncbi:Zinc finger protein 567 [Portunus trituberculatus]|uniref:Zinc finger protein 567 n=1 Tax=Portunus trituberculatus TaxID=210409 RepID=A0A5B7F0L2_PORTR|nr:Zinc finger protein 567 [Portunus trituberculatus]